MKTPNLTSRIEHEKSLMSVSYPTNSPASRISNKNYLRIKKFMISALVVAAIIFMGLNSGFAAKNTGSNPPSQLRIIYQVNVYSTPKFLLQTVPVYIVVTNERGQTVGQPQLFNPRVMTYYFYEAGPVIGTREANLYSYPLLPPIPFNWSPDFESGKFLNGNTYIFNIYIVG